MSCSDFERTQIEKLESILSAYADAIIALLTANGVKEYTLDTGQSVQRVRREDVDKLQETYGLVWQQYDALKARCDFGGAVTVVPLEALPCTTYPR